MRLYGSTLQNCDFIKFVLMIMVVLEHSIAVTNDNWFNLDIHKNNNLHWVSWTLDQFHIFAFVIISGYIFRYLQVEKNHYPVFGKFIGRKSQRLIVPLLFVSIIWTLPVNAIYFGSSMKEFIWLLIQGPSQLWFLYMLFGVYLIGWQMSKMFEHRIALIGGGMVVLYFIGILGMRYLPNPFQIWRVFIFLPFFFMGFLLRKMDAKGVEECKGTIIRIMLVVGGVSGVLLLMLMKHYINGVFMGAILIMILFFIRIVLSVLAFWIIDILAHNVRWKKSKVIGLGISMSMIVYMFHNQFVFIIIHRLYKITDLYSLIVVCFVGSILLSCLVGTILKKFKVTSYLIGEKV